MRRMTGENFYIKGIGTGIAIAVEICEQLRPTTSDVICNALKERLCKIEGREVKGESKL